MGRAEVKNRLPAILLGVLASLTCAKSVTMPVVVRDHLKGTSTQIQVTGTLFDSTAGSWVGTRPGIDGLPTPMILWDPPYDQNRHVLQKTDAAPGWPGRIGLRLDHQNTNGILGQECSGILVGPKNALTAAHCVNYRSQEAIGDGWTSDSLFVRPGFDRGLDLPASTAQSGRIAPIRVVKSWVPRSVFEYAEQAGYAYSGDDDWAILELDRDIGTELGWAAVGPLKPGDERKYYHFLSYPGYPQCHDGQFCDPVSRTDTLCHSYTPVELLYWDPTGRDQKEDWRPLVSSWFGESGAGFLDCPDQTCKGGKITARGTRWKEVSISAIDSTMSAIISTLLKDVKIPTAMLAPSVRSDFAMHLEGGFLRATSDRDGEWQVLSLDGRSMGASSFGKTLVFAQDRLPRGVALVVFRAPGQAPLTQRWVGQR